MHPPELDTGQCSVGQACQSLDTIAIGNEAQVDGRKYREAGFDEHLTVIVIEARVIAHAEYAFRVTIDAVLRDHQRHGNGHVVRNHQQRFGFDRAKRQGNPFGHHTFYGGLGLAFQRPGGL